MLFSSPAKKDANSVDDVFQIAAKAEKLLQEILSSNKTNIIESIIKQEPSVQQQQPVAVQQQQLPIAQQIHTQQYVVPTQQYYTTGASTSTAAYHQQGAILTTGAPGGYTVIPSAKYVYQPHGPGPGVMIDPNYYVKNPPPPVLLAPQVNYYQQPAQIGGASAYYQHAYLGQPSQIIPSTPYQNQHIPHYQYQNQYVNPHHQVHHHTNNNNFFRKRKFGEMYNSNNKSGGYNNNNNNNNNRYGSTSSFSSTSSSSSISSTASSSSTSQSDSLNKSTGQSSNDERCELIDTATTIDANEEEDLNIMRERELKDLKCKSVVEKMSVFLKYYQQFKDSYIQRVQVIECSDSLKIQFHSLIKYLNEYESILSELDMMITEHERDYCKNNHRKTKKFFNKTKAFIRYECNKRLQSNIFEYRRLINSQDRYAGMYDLLDMNSYLISLLPDIGVSIRRYINRCEKARQEEEEEEDYTNWYSENSNESVNDANNDSTNNQNESAGDNFSIPTFKEFVAQNCNDADSNLGEKENESDRPRGVPIKMPLLNKNYESFSKGIDALNRYLLKRVEEEESLDELVKERIIKWINKRQAKYILIFSEVDKLLNQHKDGECYPKFHSYLLFNLGKLVTVCDSYHQKLKELLYSTTIRRKKKRKKVKLLPEAMADVFDEILDLKKTLEHAKVIIKRCNMN